MPDNLLDALKKRAEKDGMTLSDEVRKACGKYLSEPDIVNSLTLRIEHLEEALRLVSSK